MILPCLESCYSCRTLLEYTMPFKSWYIPIAFDRNNIFTIRCPKHHHPTLKFTAYISAEEINFQKEAISPIRLICMMRIDPVRRTSPTRTWRTPNPRLLEPDPISPGFNPIFSSHLLTATPKRWNGGKLPQSLKDGIMSRPKDQESQKKIKCTHPNLPL